MDNISSQYDHPRHIYLIEDNGGTVIVDEDISMLDDYVYVETWVMNGIRYDLYRPKAVKLNRLSQRQKITSRLFDWFIEGKSKRQHVRKQSDPLRVWVVNKY